MKETTQTSQRSKTQTKSSSTAAKKSVLPTVLLETTPVLPLERLHLAQERLGGFHGQPKEAFPSLSLLPHHRQGTVQNPAEHLRQWDTNENSGQEENSTYCLCVTPLLSNFPSLASKPSTPGALPLFQHLPPAQHEFHSWWYTSPHNCPCSFCISKSQVLAHLPPSRSLPQLLRLHWSPSFSLPWLVPSIQQVGWSPCFTISWAWQALLRDRAKSCISDSLNSSITFS